MSASHAHETRPALCVEGLTKSFRRNRALDALDFVVPEGSLTVILGPAGAGKTTTLRLVAGLDRPDAGRVVIRGRDVAGLEPRDRDVAMIFDNLALYPDRTGFDNVASALKIAGVKPGEIRERVDAVAATLRIAHVLSRLPKTMSGGERQRVALGRALVRDPALFLLDEPLSSLDAMLRIELRAELKRLQREQGRTFLMTTPDFAEALAVADTVVMLRAGRVVQTAAPQALWDDPIDREVARFVGAPEINLLPAETIAENGGAIRLAGATLPFAAAFGAALPVGTTRFEIGIRPDHLRLVSPDAAPIRAEVVDVEPLGLESTLTVHTDAADLRLVVEASAARRLMVGETVGIDLAGPRLLAFDAESGRRLTTSAAIERS
jgi:multiple sugar transport system ATP-binding protein